MPDFSIGERDFLRDGRPFRILSGAMHYFRVHPDLWADRIAKARLMGLNTIETYVAWNAHSPDPDTFDTTGGLDLDRYLRLIAEAGMTAIVRPGPYICAEWDNGGLPPWLFRDGTVGIRRNEPQFFAAVHNYLKRVLEIVVPHQIDRGGPVILVQVENEYGAYGEDRQYLTALADVTRTAGVTVPLVTVDQPIDGMLERGRLDGVHMTASFGSRATERLATLRTHQSTGPLMCGEFWVGWFDSWGEHHHTTPAQASAAELDDLLTAGASVNIYMFHGGTNFGATNGANHKGRYTPITTSYDYDAPLDEAGRPTEKFWAFRDVIARHAPIPTGTIEPASPAPAFSVSLGEPLRLLDRPERWGRWQHHEVLPTIDAVDPKAKLLLARTRPAAATAGPTAAAGPAVLAFGSVRDRAAVYLDGVPAGVLQRDHHERALALPRSTGEITVLVEDLGRVDYGLRIGEAKGLIGGAALDGRPVTGWDVMPLALDRFPGSWTSGEHGIAHSATGGPVLVRGTFDLPQPGDLFLDTAGWGKGFVWANGFLLGRYWRRGPQRTLYVPGPTLRAQDNEIVVLELDVLADPRAHFVSGPSLGHTDI